MIAESVPRRALVDSRAIQGHYGSSRARKRAFARIAEHVNEAAVGVPRLFHVFDRSFKSFLGHVNARVVRADAPSPGKPLPRCRPGARFAPQCSRPTAFLVLRVHDQLDRLAQRFEELLAVRHAVALSQEERGKAVAVQRALCGWVNGVSHIRPLGWQLASRCNRPRGERGRRKSRGPGVLPPARKAMPQRPQIAALPGGMATREAETAVVVLPAGEPLQAPGRCHAGPPV